MTIYIGWNLWLSDQRNCKFRKNRETGAPAKEHNQRERLELRMMIGSANLPDDRAPHIVAVIVYLDLRAPVAPHSGYRLLAAVYVSAPRHLRRPRMWIEAATLHFLEWHAVR